MAKRSAATSDQGGMAKRSAAMLYQGGMAKRSAAMLSQHPASVLRTACRRPPAVDLGIPPDARHADGLAAWSVSIGPFLKSAQLPLQLR